MGHYHDTVRSRKTTSQKPQKVLRASATLSVTPFWRLRVAIIDPPGVARLAMAYPTLRSSTFRSAPLGSSGDQGPLCSICPIWLAGFPLARRSRKNLSIRCEPYAALRRRNASRIASTTAGIPPTCEDHPSPPCAAAPPTPAPASPRHHDHLGVQLATRLQQPLDHLRRVQVRQAVVEHDQRRLHPPDLDVEVVERHGGGRAASRSGGCSRR